MPAPSSPCPACGAPVFAGGPLGGLCPECLLAAGREAMDFDTLPATGSGEDDPTLPSPSKDPLPETIGPYRLHGLLGEGGMGRVYAAEQKKPIRRKVALKIVKPGMDSREILARFEAERQALALMDHPGIARVYEAGATPEGRPYFVMEYVEGLALTDYCDQRKLSLRERLELFAGVCDAVQHAHQKGIIHRDLKPSNLLVCEVDDKPVVKVIDFGVAKALGPALSEHTLFTLSGQIVGTPQYMSPEQASLETRDIDTRSDVYSLGVILYELLAGRTPLEMETLRRAGLEAVLRTIREEEPPKPSTRVSSLAEETRSAIATSRGAAPPRLAQALRGELDWIAMKALEKERSRRYPTASALAEDVRHHLADEPVSATPPSAGYRLGKFARRNRSLLSAAALVALVLVGGIIATGWQARVATREKDRADLARENAEKLVDFMLTDLRTKLADVGKLELMEGVERAVSDYYAKLPESERTEERLTRQAEARLDHSKTLEDQGRRTESLAAAEEALAVWRVIREKWPNSSKARIGLAEAHRWLAECYYQVSTRPEKAIGHLQEAAETLSELAESSSTGEIALTKARVQVDQAYSYARDSNLQKNAEDVSAAALELSLVEWSKNNDSVEWNILVAKILGLREQLGITSDDFWTRFKNPGTPAEIYRRVSLSSSADFNAKELLLDALNWENRLWKDGASHWNRESAIHAVSLARDLVAYDPTNISWKLAAVEAEFGVGDALYHSKNHQEAVAYLESAKTRLESLDAEGAQNIEIKKYRAYVLSILGLNFTALGEREKNIDCQEDAIALYDQIIALYPEDPELMGDAAYAILRLADGYEDESPKKRDSLERAFKLSEKSMNLNPSYWDTTGSFYFSAQSFAWFLFRTKEFEQAKEISDRLVEDWSHQPQIWFQNAEIYRCLGDLEKAGTGYIESIRRTRLGSDEIDPKAPLLMNEMASLTRSVRAFLVLRPHPNSDGLIVCEEAVGKIEKALDHVPASHERIRAAVGGVRGIMESLSLVELSSGDSDGFKRWIDRSSSLAMNWAEKVERIDDRDGLLVDLAAALFSLRGKADDKFRGGLCDLEPGERLLEVAEQLGLPRSDFSPSANLLVALLHYELALSARANDDSSSAADHLEAAGREFVSAISIANASEKDLPNGSGLLRRIGDLGATLEFEGSMVTWFHALIEWRRKICQSDAGKSTQPWRSLAADCEDFSRRLKDWGHPEQERLPVEQERVEALMTLHRRGDFEHNGHLINALLTLGELQQRLGDSGAAEIHFRRILEVESATADASTKQLEPWMRGRVAMAVERLGDAARKRKEWTEAEAFYRDCLVRWSTPETAPGNGVAAMDIAQRVKLHLIEVHEGAGKGGNEECRRFTEEIVAHLAPLKASGKLPTMLEGVLRAAEIRKTKAAAATGGGN